MKKRDLYVMAGAALLALVLILLYRSGLITPPKPSDGQVAREGLTISLRYAGEEASTPLALMHKGATRQPAEAYLRVTVGKSVYEPIPLDRDFELSIEQNEGQYNIAQVRGGVIHMAQASCPKHECIGQGSLSLENREFRAMQSSIICLPNQVVLELLDEKQARAYYGEGS